MDNVENMRALIEHMKIIESNIDELLEFTRVSPKESGLPYDIYIDNNEAYQTYKHPLWLYISVDGQKIPVTIEERPRIMTHNTDLSINYRLLAAFITYNMKLLKDIADDKIGLLGFTSFLIKANRLNGILNECVTLNEMSTLRTRDTLLPTIIWLDEDELYIRHAPRIKFRADFQNKDTHIDPAMEINHPDKIHNMPKHNNLNTKQLKQIQKFVTLNKDRLVDLANRIITGAEFVANSIKVDINGNIIINDHEPKITKGKKINGMIKCQMGDKFNYLKSDNEYLYPEFFLDKASDFAYSINNEICAYVTFNNDDYYINRNGERLIL